MAQKKAAKKTAAKTAEPTTIEIPAMDLKEILITLVGDSSLICHKWSDKAKQEILDKHMKKAAAPKEAKDPEKLFRESLYKMPKGSPSEYGFPAIAFKAAAVSACRSIPNLPMTLARSVFHIDCELVPIFGEPTMREDMVRIGQGTADIRFRGEFTDWFTQFVVVYNAGVFSADQILNLFHIAGFSTGVGEWRPEKNGPHGRFHIATEKDLKHYGIR